MRFGLINGNILTARLQGNDTFNFNREIEVRKNDGLPYDALSVDEQEQLENDSTLIEHRLEHVRHKLKR